MKMLSQAGSEQNAMNLANAERIPQPRRRFARHGGREAMKRP
jgi:hypothetical protein